MSGIAELKSEQCSVEIVTQLAAGAGPKMAGLGDADIAENWPVKTRKLHAMQECQSHMA